MLDQFAPPRQPHPQPPGPVSVISIADVIARLEGDVDSKPRRRREMASALRTVARLLDADPGMISAEPQNLRKRLAGISPALGGLSRGRWTNVRSLTLAALKHVGLRTLRGRFREPLPAEWEVLRARLPDAKSRYGLSRFMTFCGAQQIAPEAVDAAIFERFRQALETESLVKKPHTVHRTACMLWSQAAETIDGWPALTVAVPSASRRYALAWTDFPASFRSDAEGFLYRLGNQDPFADDYAASAKPSTIQMRRKQILQIATALVRSGCPADHVTGLAILVKLENARRALRHFLDRAGGQPTKYLHQQALLLKTIARHWDKAPHDHVAALGEICRRLAIKHTGMTDKNRARLRQFDNPANVDALINLPQRVLRDVQRADHERRDDALRVMFALAIELLIVAPMRVNNLTGLEIERHILRTRVGSAAAVHMVIPAVETKNGEPYEMELPKASIELLAIYLATYHQRLSNRACPWLFPNDQGERRCTTSLSTQIATFILRETGITMNVHLFRHLAAKLHLESCPEDIETARRILGHKNVSTTLRSYAETKTAAAFRRYDQVIQTLRAQPVAPGRGRISAAGDRS